METVLFSKIARFQFRLWLYFRLWKLQLRQNLSPERALHLDRKTSRNYAFPLGRMSFSQIPSLQRLFSSNGENNGFSKSNIPTRARVINTRILEIYEEGESLDRDTYSSVVDQLQDLFLTRQQDFNTVNLASLIHRLGSLTRTLNTHEILFTRHRVFLSKLIIRVDFHAGELKPQEVGNICWGLGLLGPRLKSIFGPDLDGILLKIGLNVMDNFKGYQAQNISNFLLGLVYLENRSVHSLLPSLMENTKSKLRSFDNQELANLIWSLAKLKYVDIPDFLPLAFTQASSILDLFIPQQLSILLWSLASFQIQDQDMLVERIMKSLLNWDGPLSSQSIANVFWSLQQLQLRFPDDDLAVLLNKCHTLLEAPIDSITSTQIRHLLNMLIALSDFQCWTEPVEKCVKILKNCFLSSRTPFNLQDLCNFLWALLIMDHHSLTEDLLAHAGAFLQDQPPEKVKDEDIRQFYQCLLHVKVFRSDVDTARVIPRELEIKWRLKWSLRQGTSPLPLWLADALICLEDLGYVCRGRFLTQGLLNTCTINLDDYFKYAIEGISLTRSYRNLPTCPRGRYRWKVKVLEAMGFEVIAITEKEWLDAIGQIQKKEYLKQKIQMAQDSASRKFLAKMKS